MLKIQLRILSPCSHLFSAWDRSASHWQRVMFVCFVPPLPCLQHLTVFISLCPLPVLLVFYLHLDLINTKHVWMPNPMALSSHTSSTFTRAAFLSFLLFLPICLFLPYPFCSVHLTSHLPLVFYFYSFPLIFLWLGSIQWSFAVCALLGCVWWITQPRVSEV